MSRLHVILAVVLLAFLLAGCTGDTAANESEGVEITTIENHPTALKTIGKPQMIEFDGGPAPAALGETADTEEPSDEDEPLPNSEEESSQWTENLPFSPKIAMDPVDGSKISIQRLTPTAEYKGRVYYFSSEGNRSEFIRNPDDYLSGAFSSY